MLILNRRVGQSISIGNDIKVIVLNDVNGIRIGIEAPKHIKIFRDELLKRLLKNQQVSFDENTRS